MASRWLGRVWIENTPNTRSSKKLTINKVASGPPESCCVLDRQQASCMGREGLLLSQLRHLW